MVDRRIYSMVRGADVYSIEIDPDGKDGTVCWMGQGEGADSSLIYAIETSSLEYADSSARHYLPTEVYKWVDAIALITIG